MDDSAFSEVPFAVPVKPFRSLEGDSPSGSDIPYVQIIEPPARLVRPPRPPHPNFGWAALWSLGYFLFLNGVVAGAGILVISFQLLLSPNPTETLAAMRQPDSAESKRLMRQATGPSLLVGNIAGLILIVTVIRLVVGKDWPRQLALRRPGWLHLLLAVLSLPGMVYVSTAVHEFTQWLPTFHYQDELQEIFGGWSWWFGMLVAGVGPGVTEELFCRGFLGRGLVGHYGSLLGILATSLFFGLMHLDPPSILATAVIGICLHFVYLMTRSLLLPILLHFLNNSLSVLGSEPGSGNAGTQDGAARLLDPTEKTPVLLYLGALAWLVAVGWALYKSRARLAPDKEAGDATWQPPYPGVAWPPPGSNTLVVWRWPGWTATGLLVAAAGLWIWVGYLVT